MTPSPVQEVEAALARFHGLDVVVVDADEDAGRAPGGDARGDAGPGDPRLVAYVASGAPDADVDVPALHAHARNSLPGRLVPAAIVVLDTLPVTATGAVDHPRLPVPDLDCFMPYQAPQGARQELLCSLFAEVLGVPRVGVEDDFFDLNGQSVHAQLLAGRISSELGRELTIVDIFEAPTVAELDRRLDEGQTGDAR
jgi:hypothetical protein